MKNCLTILILICTSLTFGQTSKDNRIVVLGEASIEIPADQVEFNVNLYSSDSTSLDKVYEDQKILEEKILKILRELNIPNKNISYSLMSVDRGHDYETKHWYYRAGRYVYFKLDSLKQFPKVQELLIKGGFYDFNSSFTSTKEELTKKEVFEKAVIVAKAKAEILANIADRKIKRIVKLSDTEESDPILYNYTGYGRGEGNGAACASMGDSLSEIPQTVTLRATVKVIFELK